MIALLCVALINILNLCCTFSKFTGDGEGWLRIMEEDEENQRAVCQHLVSKELFQVLLECCTSTQLCMLNSLHFSTGLLQHS
jgi:hypothetical protein